MRKLLANENFPLRSVKTLIDEGYDMKAISLECPGITDHEVIRIAQLEERIILTFDRDYGELVFKHGFCPPEGIIYFRWLIFTPDEPGNYLLNLLKMNDFESRNSFIVIERDLVRIRKYA